MKNQYVSWLAVVLGIGLALGLASCSQEPGRSLSDVFDNVDLQKNTKLHVEEYWKTVNGQEYKAAGRVVDVRRDRGGAEVFVAVKSRMTFRDYNVVLEVPDVSQAADLKRRQDIRFRGVLSNYRSDRDGGSILTLKGAEILK